MRAVDRIALIDRIGRELQNRFRYEEIDTFLGAYGIAPPQNVSTNSKWVYSKAALRSTQPDILIKIAEELDQQWPEYTTLARQAIADQIRRGGE